MTPWLLKLLECIGKIAKNRRYNIEHRGNLLEAFISEYKLYKMGSLLSAEVAVGTDDDSDSFDPSEHVRVHDVLTFLTKVCYHKAIGSITEKEFQFFKGDIECVLKNGIVRDWMVNYHVSRGIGVKGSPYLALIEHCKAVNNPEIGRVCMDIESNFTIKRNPPERSEKITISTNDEKTYRTHLDVLNGIFNKGLLAHARGVSPLDENTFVWFPHIFKDRSSAGDRLWFNLMTEDGHEIREICTNIKKLKRFSEAAKGPRRYVFAKVHQDELVSDYKFMGVYEFKRNEKETENGFCWVYERTADSLAY